MQITKSITFLLGTTLIMKQAGVGRLKAKAADLKYEVELTEAQEMWLFTHHKSTL